MEHVKNIIAWELLFILVFAALLVIDSTDNLNKITGRAIQGVTQESVRQELETTLPKLNFANDVSDASLCLIVNIDVSTKYVYDIVKIGEAISIVNSTGYCKGEKNEDFIVSYISYAKLKEHIDNPPTISQLKSTGDGTNFYLYPSKQILAGSRLADPTSFYEKFGIVLRKNFNQKEIQQILNPQTPELQGTTSLVSYIFYFIIGMIFLVVAVLLLIFTKSKKPEVKEDLELTAYIKSYLSQGYDQEQIRDYLMQNGWPQDKIQQAFDAVSREVTVPETFA